MITCFFKVSIREVSCCPSYQSFNFLNPWKFMDSYNSNRFNKRRLYSTCRTPEFRHISIRHAPEPAHLPGSTRVRSGTLHFGEFRRSPPVRFRAVQRWTEELHRYVLLTTLPLKFKCKRLFCRSKIRHGRGESGAVVPAAPIQIRTAGRSCTSQAIYWNDFEIFNWLPFDCVPSIDNRFLTEDTWILFSYSSSK